MRYFLGLDGAKDSFVATVIDEAGHIIASAKFANNLEGFQELLAWLPAPAHTIGVCEPTGVYTQRLKETLATALESLHEINSQTLKQYTFSQVRTKTDEADALNIANAARTLFLTNPEKLAKTRVAWNPQRENLALWLAEYDRLRKCIATLRLQIGSLDHHAAPDARTVQKRREKELKRLLAEQNQVKGKIEEAYLKLDDAQARLIDSIPGLGPLSTAATLSIVRDVSRFRSADALKAYLGIYPRRNQSGNRERRSHLAHHGSKLMRHVLWNAAKAAVIVKHQGNPFRSLFDRLIAKGRTYNHAIGAVCRKLVQVIYGVLKSQTTFQFATSTP